MSQGQKFRDLAQAMQKTIDDKRRPRLENTWRRANIAASIRDDARKLERLQDKLFALADAHDAGAVPALLQPLKHKAQVQAMLYYDKVYGDYVLKQTGYTNAADYLAARDQLLALGSASAGKKTQADLIADLEKGLLGQKIPGFFPTPLTVVQVLLAAADIQPRDRVLEPSAGKGNIAEAVRRYHPTVHLDVIEINSQLRDILIAKGFAPLPTRNFLEYVTGGYDVIVMNPPFENFQDIQHVRHAWTLLKPGGRLVAIMSESVFFRQDKMAEIFRDWLIKHDAIVGSLPEGAFKESGTMVRTRVVCLENPPTLIPYPPMKTPALASPSIPTSHISPDAVLPPSETVSTPALTSENQKRLPGF